MARKWSENLWAINRAKLPCSSNSPHLQIIEGHFVNQIFSPPAKLGHYCPHCSLLADEALISISGYFVILTIKFLQIALLCQLVANDSRMTIKAYYA